MELYKLHKAYLKYLKSNFNKERAAKEKAYLYSEHIHYGLSAAEMDYYFRKHRRKWSNLTKQEALRWVSSFWQQPSHEEKMLGLDILNLHAKSLDIGDIPLIEKLMRESRGWVYLDNLIIPLMPQIIKKDKSALAILKKWIKDDDFWVRRSALLAQLLIFRKGMGGEGDGSGGDRELFFEMAQSQFDENWLEDTYPDTLQKTRARFFIRKAIGWVLREMSAKQPEQVLRFLRENRDKMSGLSYREAVRKLDKIRK